MLHPNVSSMLADPVVKKAIMFWVGQVVVMMGQVRSEKAIKLWLRRKCRGASETGIAYIYKLAQVEFEYQKQKRHGNHQSN